MSDLVLVVVQAVALTAGILTIAVAGVLYGICLATRRLVPGVDPRRTRVAMGRAWGMWVVAVVTIWVVVVL